eukprot:scaffold75502_cov32-Tisochrysis_lutea.AAC.5
MELVLRVCLGVRVVHILHQQVVERRADVNRRERDTQLLISDVDRVPGKQGKAKHRRGCEGKADKASICSA